MEMDMGGMHVGVPSPPHVWKGPFFGHLLPGLGLLLWAAAWASAWLTVTRGGAARRARPRGAAGVAAARGGGYAACGAYSAAELAVRSLVSGVAIATEMASARVNTGGTMHWRAP